MPLLAFKQSRELAKQGIIPPWNRSNLLFIRLEFHHRKPFFYSRSPHRNGRMSPPISSPQITSGSTTPLTGGTGAIPFGYLKQSANLQEGLGSTPKPPNALDVSGSSYNETNPDIFLGLQLGSNIFSELVPSENDALGIGRSVHGESYDGQSVLAGRVSRQLLKDHAMMNPSLNLSPSSPSPNQASVIM